MEGIVYPVRLPAARLHYVYLAAVGPAAVFVIAVGGAARLGKHPEGGPQSLDCGQFYARLDIAVCKAVIIARHYARRGECCAVGHGLALRRYLHRAARHGYIVACGVILKFVVAPRPRAHRRTVVVLPARLIRPFRHVERSTVEFVAPHQLPVAPGAALGRFGLVRVTLIGKIGVYGADGHVGRFGVIGIGFFGVTGIGIIAARGIAGVVPAGNGRLVVGNDGNAALCRGAVIFRRDGRLAHRYRGDKPVLYGGDRLVGA